MEKVRTLVLVLTFGLTLAGQTYAASGIEWKLSQIETSDPKLKRKFEDETATQRECHEIGNSIKEVTDFLYKHDISTNRCDAKLKIINSNSAVFTSVCSPNLKNKSDIFFNEKEIYTRTVVISDNNKFEIDMIYERCL